MGLVAAIAGLAGCGSGSGGSNPGGSGNTAALPPAVQSAVQKGAPVDSGLVAANNQMGISIFNQLRGTGPQQNLAISPTSVELALSMAYNGAAGSTATAMANAMQLSGTSVADLDNKNAALQASLVNPDKNVTFTIANSLWTHGSSQINPAFIAANQNYFAANVGDLSGAPDNINTWVSNATNGLITNIAPQTDYSLVVAVLVNALYFKGAWQNPFYSGQTQALPFNTAASGSKSVQMMSQISPLKYYAGSNFQMVEMPYGTGREMMVVVLPNSGVDLNTVESQLTPQNLSTWMQGAASTMVWVQMPKFKTSYTTDISAALKSMGMSVAFDPNQADFSNLSSSIKPLYIQWIQHATTVEVDENGTVASAATSVGIGTTSEPAIQQTVKMDHPFLYVILDSKTGEMLFVGQMTDPTQ
jgi:serpin B